MFLHRSFLEDFDMENDLHSQWIFDELLEATTSDGHVKMESATHTE